MNTAAKARPRTVLVALASIVAGLLALWGAAGSEGGDEAKIGPLLPVLVSTQAIAAGEVIDSRTAGAKLTVRRIPAEYVPSGVLNAPQSIIGRRIAADLPPGAYLTESALGASRRSEDRPPDRLPAGSVAVEIGIDGSAGLDLPQAGAAATGRPRVDVVVTSMPSNGRSGRTYIAATGVPVLGLNAGRAAAGAEQTAILGLERGDALELIHAESYARSIRLLGAGTGPNTLR